MAMEIKAVNLENVSVEGRTITGYASVFGGVDSYGDTIHQGAFAEALKKYGTPKMFFNHETQDIPIGKWLSVEEDEKGLKVVGEIGTANPNSENILKAIQEGVVDGLSIGFFLDRDGYEYKDDQGRDITKVARLYEISVVTFPADNSARIAEVRCEEIKDQLKEVKTERDLEHVLRDLGLSKSLAQALWAKAKDVINAQRDSEDVTASQLEKAADLVARLNNLTKE